MTKAQEEKLLNLLILTTTFPKSREDYGTPRFVYDLAYNISQKGIKTIVLTPDRPDSNITFEVISDNFTIHRFRYFLKKYQKLTSGEGILPTLKKSKLYFGLIPFLIISQFFKTIKYIKKYNIDNVNSHWLVPSGLIGAIVQKLYRKRNYVTVHAAGLYLLARIPFGKKIANFIYKNSTKILIVSNFGKEKFYELISKPDKKTFDNKVKVIPMGVYIKSFLKVEEKIPLDKNKFHILFLGRIVEKKGLKYAIEAINRIEEGNIKFHICGSGPLKSELEKQVKKLNLEKKITFYGRISEEKKVKFFNSVNVLLVPSIETARGDKEGLPVVILESLVAGLPIIASDVGGIKDGVINNYTGKLIKQKNISEIINAIKELKNDKEMLNKMRDNCIKHSKNFDWTIIADKYIREMISLKS
ncbi:MAG: glycosyltransferase [Candidatus Heimdallarchaeota archaeon]|nr:glycosyltransferase [Candidatus Heimdallarchaeota archaeon]